MSQTTIKVSSKKKSKNAECLEKWKNSGKSIPICVNVGCEREVAIRDWKVSGIPSVRSECSRCATKRKNGQRIPGVTFHKKNYCENRDKQLGFLCPLDPERYHELPGDVYDMDHIDGDHFNNDPKNLQTLCKVCHAMKGKASGDFNSQKESSRTHN